MPTVHPTYIPFGIVEFEGSLAHRVVKASSSSLNTSTFIVVAEGSAFGKFLVDVQRHGHHSLNAGTSFSM